MVNLKRLCDELAELSRTLSDLADVLEDQVAAPRGLVGLTESETEQGREPPPGCEPVSLVDGAGYHPGSAADPRD